MPAQDRVRSDQAMATQRFGQPRDEGGEHGPVRPIQARSRVSATQDGDLVAQHEELDILGGGGTAHQQDQPKHLPEDQVRQPQRYSGIMSDRRSPLASDPAPSSGTPQVIRVGHRGPPIAPVRINGINDGEPATMPVRHRPFSELGPPQPSLAVLYQLNG